MSKIQNYSFHEDLLERFNKIVPPGQRSAIINQLVSEYCDKYDSVSLERNLRLRWIVSTVVPFIKQYSKKNRMDDYAVLNSKAFYLALSESGIEATRDDVNEALAHIWREEEKNGRAR